MSKPSFTAEEIAAACRAESFSCRKYVDDGKLTPSVALAQLAYEGDVGRDYVNPDLFVSHRAHYAVHHAWSRLKLLNGYHNLLQHWTAGDIALADARRVLATLMAENPPAISCLWAVFGDSINPQLLEVAPDGYFALARRTLPASFPQEPGQWTWRGTLGGGLAIGEWDSEPTDDLYDDPNIAL